MRIVKHIKFIEEWLMSTEKHLKMFTNGWTIDLSQGISCLVRKTADEVEVHSSGKKTNVNTAVIKEGQADMKGAITTDYLDNGASLGQILGQFYHINCMTNLHRYIHIYICVCVCVCVCVNISVQ